MRKEEKEEEKKMKATGKENMRIKSHIGLPYNH